MILYLDASALVKRYVLETESAEVEEAIANSRLYGTGTITQVEVVAALARAVRVQKLTAANADVALRGFRIQWPDLIRLPVSEPVITIAADFAWTYGLRGYDAVHLAAARSWADALSSQVTFATFDRRLWEAAQRVGMSTYPAEILEDFLAEITPDNLHGATPD